MAAKPNSAAQEAFQRLVAALARGEQFDAGRAAEVCRQAGRSYDDLLAAVGIHGAARPALRGVAPGGLRG